jgi:diacylglycerol kinase family enzyme
MQNTGMFDIIVNRLAGTVMAHGVENVAQGLREIFAEKTGNIMLVEGRDIAATVRNWAAIHAGQQNRGLIIGGGDGSLITAVGEVMGQDVALGLLPLGTQNFVARNLGYSADFREAAKQYKNSIARPVDIGVVNGHYFLFGVMADKNSVNLFEGREDLRKENYSAALAKISSFAIGLIGPRLHFSVSQDGQPGTEQISTRILAVTVNRLAPKPVAWDEIRPDNLTNIVGKVGAKPPGADGTLTLYTFSGGGQGMDVSLAALKGEWDTHRSIQSRSAPGFTIRPAQAEQGQATSIILDGEIRKTSFPLEISIIPSGIRLYSPQ